MYADALSKYFTVTNVASCEFFNYSYEDQNNKRLFDEYNMNISDSISIYKLYKLIKSTSPDHIIIHETYCINKLKIANMLANQNIPITIVKNCAFSYKIQKLICDLGTKSYITSNPTLIDDKSNNKRSLKTYFIPESLYDKSWYKSISNLNSSCEAKLSENDDNFDHIYTSKKSKRDNKAFNIGFVIKSRSSEKLLMIVKSIGALVYLHKIHCNVYIDKKILGSPIMQRLIDMYNLQGCFVAVDRIDDNSTLSSIDLLCLMNESRWHDLLPMKAAKHGTLIAYFAEEYQCTNGNSGNCNKGNCNNCDQENNCKDKSQYIIDNGGNNTDNEYQDCYTFESVADTFLFISFKDIVSIARYIIDVPDISREMARRNFEICSNNFSMDSLAINLKNIIDSENNKANCIDY